ncbi:hypothetical protein [Pelagibacterium luteolum]|uniref:Uncharacterized protein n=1 Tax=Pelagibacterium luteolum TaxID=440168 RepID=A0A1G7VY62_9HYPH|nr:hypothetical protein [Pelagibacterium luteolum]SDG64379.1 hypothetical protein SAMN04487974_10568 [Pelagibacterium luteolum]
MARRVLCTGLAVLTVSTGMIAGPALAQNVHISRLYEQVLENIEYAEAGHVLDTFGVFRLNEGGTVRIEIDVPAEASIQVMGDCDEDCIDLDLTIYDAEGELLGEDRLPDFYPIVDFISGADGRVTIELDMVDCDASYCYTAYSVFIDAAP